MGYLDNVVQVGGVLVAVLFLAMEAIVFNRIFGGLPYPLWRFNEKVDKIYRSLAGHAPSGGTRWQKIAEKTFQRRRSFCFRKFKMPRMMMQHQVVR